MADERWFTTKQIAELLQVSDATVWRWLKSGQMRGINLSGKSGWRVRKSEVNAFIEAREGKVAA
jgi:excisionase family DNA binding protein